MKIPVYEYVTCPECNKVAYISMMNSGLYWLADVEWTCPYCKEVNSTEEFQKASG
jgi:phage FluMu protein Com